MGETVEEMGEPTKPLTAGDLKQALLHVPDSTIIRLEVEDEIPDQETYDGDGVQLVPISCDATWMDYDNGGDRFVIGS